MKTLSLLTVLFLFSFTGKDIRKHNWENGNPKYSVEMKNGMFNGDYTLWYESGKKHAEGTFRNNQRTGTWKVWDTAGVLRMTREYQNNFQFKITSMKNEKGDDVPIHPISNYSIERNSTGFIDYPKTKEKSIFYQKRIWRLVEADENNKLLFYDNRLMNIIIKGITVTNKFKAYDSNNFRNELSPAEITSKLTGELNIVGFRIKEDHFYDQTYQFMDVRIMALCPVTKDKATGNLANLFWVYYPSIRESLAIEKVDIANEDLVKIIEDIFQFRYFSSTIYKESNVWDREISAYKPSDEMKDEAERIEMDLLNLEQDFWTVFPQLQ